MTTKNLNNVKTGGGGGYGGNPIAILKSIGDTVNAGVTYVPSTNKTKNTKPTMKNKMIKKIIHTNYFCECGISRAYVIKEGTKCLDCGKMKKPEEPVQCKGKAGSKTLKAVSYFIGTKHEKTKVMIFESGTGNWEMNELVFELKKYKNPILIHPLFEYKKVIKYGKILENQLKYFESIKTMVDSQIKYIKQTLKKYKK